MKAQKQSRNHNKFVLKAAVVLTTIAKINSRKSRQRNNEQSLFWKVLDLQKQLLAKCKQRQAYSLHFALSTKNCCKLQQRVV